MELHPASQLEQGQDARQDIKAYLDRLPLSPAQQGELYARIAEQDADTPMRAMHCALAETQHALHPAYASVPARLKLAQRGQTPAAEMPPYKAPLKLSAPRFAPPLNRKSMVPSPWGVLNPALRWLESTNQRFWQSSKAAAQAAGDALAREAPHQQPWQKTGNRRRLCLLVLMLLQTALATYFMMAVLPYHGQKLLELGMLALFATLFCWVSSGFWTALAGFLLLLRGTDPYLISRHKLETAKAPINTRTAIVMPICNEDVVRVFAGLRATYESLASSGHLQHFDFFVLSDTNQADTYVAELHAWQALRSSGAEQVFYRHRRRRIKRKSGNIDDFCRRWGANYAHMIVLDADSVMSGDCLATLVRLMQANPGVGIIQTAPRASGRDSMYARMQQFAMRVYGPLFTAGLHFWQLGESHYWGHNAIIRIQPFMQHCALAPLPGDGVLVGEILSHDFVEAALMRRAGWSVWIAYDLDGSYEETPPNLLDELSRDRRWCQGNLMNFRLLLAHGFHIVHRVVFVTGVMAYVSAPIWLLFLMVSTALLASHTLIDPQYFTEPGQLFPLWPEWHPQKALALFSATATLLFLPKILSIVLIAAQDARGFGGKLRLTLSMLLESLNSMLLAPVRMLFHTYFVISAFLGWNAGWKSPPRDDNETGWGEALQRHGWGSLLGAVWTMAVYKLSPGYFWWWLPITGSLMLSIPISVLSSRTSWGRLMRKIGLFLIPEEKNPPQELLATARYAAADQPQPDFVAAVVDPICNALICAHGQAHPYLPRTSQQTRAEFVARALREGPAALSPQDKLMLLDDALLLSQLHLDAWSATDAHPDWRPSPAISSPPTSSLETV
jgi:membrane glycosyltransferase